jgi:preprotein translocase subunit YajC
MPQQPQGANLFIFVSQFVLIIGIFYFILIRPQKQEQRRVQDMLSKMAKNDEVVTAGGIHGTIVGLKDKTVTLRVDENVKIEVERKAIAEVVKKQGANQG